jgi:cell division protein FtsN
MHYGEIPPIVTVDANAAANLDFIFNQLIAARNMLIAAWFTTPVSTYACAQAKADFLQKRKTMLAGMRMYPEADAWVLKIQNSGMLKEPVPHSGRRQSDARRLTQAERVAVADNELEQVAASLAAAKTQRTYLKLQLLNLDQPGQCIAIDFTIIVPSKIINATTST